MEVVLLFLSFLFFLLAVLFMLLMNGGKIPFFEKRHRPDLEDLSKLTADAFALEYNNYRQESLRRGGLK
jgi:hypothetical protein